jgi:hypothetical protein
VLGGTLAGVLAIEGILRLRAPRGTFGAGSELANFREGGARVRGSFELDPEMGFRPALGRGPYSRFGTLGDEYPETKTPGVVRVLFAGDSVTARGRIVDALRDRYGDARYEYWNAGVESFNTVQEVRFYERYNRALHPDQVVLTFHLNDFETTPVAFVDGDDRLVVYAPSWPLRRPNRWLFRHSLAYRAWLGLTNPGPRDRSAVSREVEDALRRLRDLVSADGGRLSVVVLPLLKPLDEWTSDELSRRSAIAAILRDLGIRSFDLVPVLEEVLARGGVRITETPDDVWHPSDAVARAFAARLQEQGLLAN